MDLEQNTTRGVKYLFTLRIMDIYGNNLSKQKLKGCCRNE